MTTYSHSRISSFEQCPLKFRFKYIDKLKPDFEQSIEGFLGNKVHESLEWLYQNSLQGNLKQLDEVLEYFIALWQKEFSEKIKIIKFGTNPEDYFHKGIGFLVNYFTENYPFKDFTIATEREITITLDEEEKYKLIGFIDRLAYNPETKILEIHDYKTGALKSQEELDKDRQLAVYYLGIQKDFSEKVEDVHLIWHYLAHSKKMISRRNPEELESLKQEIISKIKIIESTENFEPKKSPLCNWCEFQSKCPLFKSKNQ
jgi:putative RecB family exonuclease